MVWIKDTVTLKPKIVYLAPPEALPMVRIIYDPKAKINKWTIEYAYLNAPTSSLVDIERLMGL